MIKSVGLYCDDAAVALSPGLKPKDRRYDPVVAVGLVALEKALAACTVQDADRTAIIGVTDQGCSSHVGKVSAGIAGKKPRQAFFARAGAQTIATYAAMALNCHGPAMTLSGSAPTASAAWQIASHFVAADLAHEVIVIGADRVADRLVGAAFLLSRGDNDHDEMVQLLAQASPQDDISPVMRLHAAGTVLLQNRPAVP